MCMYVHAYTDHIFDVMLQLAAEYVCMCMFMCMCMCMCMYVCEEVGAYVCELLT